MSSMRIKGMMAENFKRLELVNLEFADNGVIVISGGNGAGKSSVIDAIIATLFGKGAAPKTPIRKGADKATLQVILEEGGDFEYGDLTVSKTFTDPADRSKQRLTVKSNGGGSYSQNTLHDLFGDLTLDPSAFIAMSGKERREVLLKSVADLSIDLDESAAQRKRLYDERTDINRDVKRSESQIAGMDKPEEGLPDEVQSSRDILEKIEKVDAVRTGVVDIDNEIATTENNIGDIGLTIIHLDERITALINEKENAIAKRGELIAESVDLKNNRDGAPTLDSLDEQRNLLKSEIETIEETNAKIRAAEQYILTEEDLTRTKMRSKHLTENIEQIDAATSKALTNATFPLEGLSLEDEDITFKGLSFDDACTSDQVKIAAAIAIAQNPKAKFIFLKNGNILDPENLRILNDYAVEKDFQIVMEYVVTGPENAVGFYIEEGEIVEIKPSKVS
jgi:DNA repair exonuclease SbcCD ATPase subunit